MGLIMKWNFSKVILREKNKYDILNCERGHKGEKEEVFLWTHMVGVKNP
jgi:hypothetical protein